MCTLYKCVHYLVQLYELGVGPGHLDGYLHYVLLLRHDGTSWLHRYSAANGKTELLGTCGIYMKYIESHLRTYIKTMWPKWTRVCTKNESPSFRQQKGGIRKRELTVCKSDGCLALIQQPFYTWSCRTRRFLFHGLFMECWVKLKQVTSCPYRHLQSFHRSSHFLLGSDRLFPEDKEEAAVALQTLPRPPPQSVDTWTTHTVWCWVFCALTGSVWLTAQPVLDLLDAFCILSLPASKRKLAVFNKATLPLLSQQPHASRPPRLPEKKGLF